MITAILKCSKCGAAVPDDPDFMKGHVITFHKGAATSFYEAYTAGSRHRKALDTLAGI